MKHMAFSLLSLRDAIKYPMVLFIFNVFYDFVIQKSSIEAVSKDYILSILILPIVIILCDMIPPHITHNYRFFENPGIKRIIKVGEFLFIAHVLMFTAQIIVSRSCGCPFLPTLAQCNDDSIEQCALTTQIVAERIKFLP